MRSATIAGNVYEVSSDGATILVQEVAVMPPHFGPQLPGVRTTNRLRLPAATWRTLLPLIAEETGEAEVSELVEQVADREVR